MKKNLKIKIKEALSSVLPITAIVLFLSVTVVPMPIGTILLFMTGAVLLIVGMGLFSLGADVAMLPMGEGIGTELTKSQKVGFVTAVAFILGLLITIAEPDLQVLAHQVPTIPDMVLIITVALGVGIFLAIAALRTFFKIHLTHVFIFFYALVFILAVFAPGDFVSMAFDSGGVTTGPITVPFIMALGVGLASIRSGKGAQDDSFGLVGIASIGPILTVLVLGIWYNPSIADYTAAVIPDVLTTKDVAQQFGAGILVYFREVCVALIPIVLFFIVFQLISKRFKKRQLIKIGVGLVYTLGGLVLFLTGVNIGFLPTGHYIGAEITASPYAWLLLPLSMVIGYFIVAAEPAVHVLNKQVEGVSHGAIPYKSMQRSLAIGMAAALALAMVRVLTGISIFWFLIPGYLAALILSFFVPKIFMGIAFDSGGVVSGPMTATFLLPFAIGACGSAGGNIMTDAFGIVAMVAMMPLISIQLMGLMYDRKMKAAAAETDVSQLETEDVIVDYEEGKADA
ncbi:MAG: DUF1538 domain-containing protein [Clostridia bacterium]|jgi:intracellular septation protein A|nr:DUF1538 domain-containing protein [Clostridia bacterium]